jgi:hypothetical protein
MDFLMSPDSVSVNVCLKSTVKCQDYAAEISGVVTGIL